MHGLYSLFGKDKDSKHQQQKQSEECQAKYFATGVQLFFMLIRK